MDRRQRPRGLEDEAGRGSDAARQKAQPAGAAAAQAPADANAPQ